MTQNGVVGFTLDMWTDIKQRHFVGITVYYIKVSDEKLTSAILSVYEFPNQKKSGETIRASIQNTCVSLGIDIHHFVKCSYFVTDQASNMIAALATYNRLPCACHMIATALRHVFCINQDGDFEVGVDEDDADSCELFGHIISDTIVACKSLVSYVKRSGLNNKFKSYLKTSQ